MHDKNYDIRMLLGGKGENMQLELPITEYEFTYNAKDTIHFSQNSGSQWHSVLGKALRELCCYVPDNQCENCMFSSQCHYSGLFHGISTDLDPIQLGSNIPTPHIIRISQTTSYQVRKDTNFTVKIVLVGNANQYLETLVRAMFIAGQAGFGKQRKKAQLIKVVEKIAEGNDKTLFDEVTPLKTVKPNKVKIPRTPTHALLKFVTPYKPTGKSANKNHLEVDRFIMSIIRRLSLLQYFTTGKRLDGDFKQLKKLTETVPVETDFHWEKNTHHTQQKTNYKHGWLGQTTFDLREHEQLWQFLYLGQWLHAGKNASMGFGQYQVTRISTI